MLRHPLRLLALTGDCPRAHSLYHQLPSRLQRQGRLERRLRADLRSDFPWMTALSFLPEEMGYRSLDEIAEVLERAPVEVQRTNRVDRESGRILQFPFIEEGAYIDARAELSGGIYVHAGVFIAPEAIVRMDEKFSLVPLVIGEGTNIQDEVLVHADAAAIGARCIVAHDAVVHGAVLEDDVTVYIKVVVDTNAHVGRGAFLDAGAYVGRGVTIPEGRYVGPLTAVRTQEEAQALPQVTPEQRAMREEVHAHNLAHARHYVEGQRTAIQETLEAYGLL